MYRKLILTRFVSFYQLKKFDIYHVSLENLIMIKFVCVGRKGLIDIYESLSAGQI